MSDRPVLQLNFLKFKQGFLKAMSDKLQEWFWAAHTPAVTHCLHG